MPKDFCSLKINVAVETAEIGSQMKLGVNLSFIYSWMSDLMWSLKDHIGKIKTMKIMMISDKCQEDYMI